MFTDCLVELPLTCLYQVSNLRSMEPRYGVESYMSDGEQDIPRLFVD